MHLFSFYLFLLTKNVALIFDFVAIHSRIIYDKKNKK